MPPVPFWYVVQVVALMSIASAFGGAWLCLKLLDRR